MNIPKISLLATLALVGVLFVPAQAGIENTPMFKANQHLKAVHAMLSIPNPPPHPKKGENAIVRHLDAALINLGQAKENKGSQLPLAVKAVTAAKAEALGGLDAAQRTKVLAHVKDALDRIEKAWKNNH